MATKTINLTGAQCGIYNSGNNELKIIIGGDRNV